MGWKLLTSAACCRRLQARRSRGWLALLCLAAALPCAGRSARAEPDLQRSEIRRSRARRALSSAARSAASTSIPRSSWQSPVSDAWAAARAPTICAGWCSRARRSAARSIPRALPIRPMSARPGHGNWQAMSLQPDDGIVLSYFFGPGFNDGDIMATAPNRKSLGSNVLFREALDLGYHITPVYRFPRISTTSRTAASPSRTRASTMSAFASASVSEPATGAA